MTPNRCPNCGQATSPAWVACPNCGTSLLREVAPQAASMASQNSQGVSGDSSTERPMIRRKPSRFSEWLWKGLVLIMVLCVGVPFAVAGLGMLNGGQSRGATGRSALPTVVVREGPYQVVSDRQESMTDAQFEDYAATITGRRVEWQGWVSEVKETDTGFEVYIDMDNPDETFIPVADIIWLTSSRTALTFSKRDPIQFEGTIVQVARPLGHLVITVE